MSALDHNAIKAAVDLEGYYWMDDANVGHEVVNFLRDGLPFDSATGLKLVQRNILQQPVCCRRYLKIQNYLLTVSRSSGES